MPARQKENIRKPFVSIIVVAWNNEAEIARALLSTISSENRNYEVIVVYNKSDDKTLEQILSVTKQHKSLFRLIKNQDNRGSGYARNQGIKAARGTYLLFLDGDDWFSQDALPTIYHYARKLSPPVLYFNFAISNQSGLIEPGNQATPLHKGWRTTGSERASLLRHFGVSWNRAYRRDFILSHDIRFADGVYQDLSWNLEVLCCARKIYVIPDVLIFYSRREGSALNSKGEKHFAILTNSRRALHFLEANPPYLRDFGYRSYKKCLDDLIGTLEMRIPPHLQNEYLKQANALLQEFRSLIGREKMNSLERVLSLNLHAAYIVFLVTLTRRAKSACGSFVKRMRGIARPLSGVA